MTPSDVQSLKDQATGFTDAPLYWPNQSFSRPEPPSPFVWVEITGLRGELAAIGSPGNNTWRDDGFLRFHVMTPQGTGTDDGYTLADTLARLYRGQKLGNVQVEATLPPVTGEDGDWFVTSFSAAYYLYFNG